MLVLHHGYTKFCCFLCEWDSRDRKHHCIQKQWPKQETFILRQKNVVNTPLINPENIYVPPLHFRLDLIKKVRQDGVGHNNSGFMYLKNKFYRITDAKIREGIFVVPQMRELIPDVKFEDQLSKQKRQQGNHSKLSLPIFWEIIRQETVVLWWMILYSPT